MCFHKVMSSLMNLQMAEWIFQVVSCRLWSCEVFRVCPHLDARNSVRISSNLLALSSRHGNISPLARVADEQVWRARCWMDCVSAAASCGAMRPVLDLHKSESPCLDSSLNTVVKQAIIETLIVWSNIVKWVAKAKVCSRILNVIKMWWISKVKWDSLLKLKKS